MNRLAAAALVVLVLATGALAKREFVAQADDFQCLTKGVHAPASSSTSSTRAAGRA